MNSTNTISFSIQVNGTECNSPCIISKHEDSTGVFTILFPNGESVKFDRNELTALKEAIEAAISIDQQFH